jgi:hypothetical protein
VYALTVTVDDKSPAKTSKAVDVILVFMVGGKSFALWIIPLGNLFYANCYKICLNS